MNCCVLIPARYNSSRFPGKPLVKILGKEMIIHVAEAASKVLDRNDVYVLTDDKRIEEVVNKNNFKCIMTSRDAKTGSDRMAEIIEDLSYKVFINVQGDEPLVKPEDIAKCAELKNKNPFFVINGFAPIDNWEDFNSLNVPKVITDKDDFLIYMSRSPIPASKNKSRKLNGLKRQVCIYGFSKEDLLFIKNNQAKQFLEESEDIEILRFIEANRKVLMFECSNETVAVDTPNDLKKVIFILNSQRETT